MRRASIVVVLAVLMLVPGGADARSFAGTVFGTMTAPFRMVVHRIGIRRFAYRHRHYRPIAHARHRRGVARVTLPRIPAEAAVEPPTIPAPGRTRELQRSAPAATTATAPATATPGPSAALGQSTAALAGAQQASARQLSPPQPPGWAGPLYWPNAADDLIGYVLQPAASGVRFWTRGGRDLGDAIFMRTSAGGAWQVMCGAQRSPESWREQIAKAVAPTEAQRPALDALGAALAEAENDIKAACPADASASPPQRLGTMIDRVWAMRQAVIRIRPALETFYGTLTDQQKKTLDDLSETAAAPDATDAIAAARQAALQACANPAAAMVPWPNGEIERGVRPANEQRQPLQTLQMTAQGMGQLLMASCPKQLLTTPLERLDAAEKRLNAMLYATRVVGPALQNFYGSLTDQQKASFDALGREARTAPPTIPSVARGAR